MPENIAAQKFYGRDRGALLEQKTAGFRTMAPNAGMFL
jgi:hypothetical protein